MIRSRPLKGFDNVRFVLFLKIILKNSGLRRKSHGSSGEAQRENSLWRRGEKGRFARGEEKGKILILKNNKNLEKPVKVQVTFINKSGDETSDVYDTIVWAIGMI